MTGMRTVTVTGHGDARVVPDSAVVRVAAVHRAAGVADALAGADSAARQVVATGREHTTPERIGSTSVQIWPAHDQSGAAAGFEARHSLTLRCADIDTAGALLAALAESVGDRLQIEGVSLEVTDRTAAETAAREAAYRDALERGGHLAGLAAAVLGDPQEVVEGGVVPIVGQPRAAKVMATDVALEPGEMSVTSSVTVSFQLH
jgi:uncharacterized protein YggE